MIKKKKIKENNNIPKFLSNYLSYLKAIKGLLKVQLGHMNLTYLYCLNFKSLL